MFNRILMHGSRVAAFKSRPHILAFNGGRQTAILLMTVFALSEILVLLADYPPGQEVP